MFAKIPKSTRECIFYMRVDGEQTYIIHFNHVGRDEYIMFISGKKHLDHRKVTWLDASAADDYSRTESPEIVKGWITELVAIYLDALLDFEVSQKPGKPGCPFISFTSFFVNMY